MRGVIFTSNQPRHISLIEDLAKVFDDVTVVQEVTTISPGNSVDFYPKSAVMREYFGNVLRAEKMCFGAVRFLPKNTRSISIKYGDLAFCESQILGEIADGDVFIVFGASFIKGALLDFLISRKAINLHMGLSPLFRGNSCNFWAIFDGYAHLVGATIHLLDKSLDGGAVLASVRPSFDTSIDPFLHGMRGVLVAHKLVLRLIENGNWHSIDPIVQDLGKTIRLSRKAEFNDRVVSEYFRRIENKSVYQNVRLDEGVSDTINCITVQV